MSKTIKSILLAGLISLSANVLALSLKADAPDRYTVKKTDTLWDIAGKYTSSPWEWPEIWYVNPQIENPHLIFPGDEISLIQVDGKQRVTVTVRGEASNTVKLKPGARIEPIEAAIPAIPQDAIRSFLRNNRIVTAQELDSAPRVLAGLDERLLFGAGEKLYARGNFGTTAPAYGVYRQGQLYRDPSTNEVLGLEAVELGSGRVLAQQDDIVTLQLDRTNQQVAIGDVLLSNAEGDLNTTYFPKAPAKAVSGRIIASASGMTNIGQFDIVVLNRGEREGLEKGAVLQVSKAGAVVYDRKAGDKVRLPSEQAGTIMVFRTTEKLAYALVLRTSRVLSVGDTFENPAL
ncbi:MAG: hypothetical protein RL217_216 [Pseudomonadota bacterium]|jgi:nucleoid-associated protein YgaU